MNQDLIFIVFVMCLVLAALLMPPGPGSPLPDAVQRPEELPNPLIP
jgi:hypothetical protein